MQISELLKRITPLPWNRNVPAKNVTKLIGDNRAYAHHAANRLPELIEAMRHISGCDFWGKSIQFRCERCNKAEEALKKAERVEL